MDPSGLGVERGIWVCEADQQLLDEDEGNLGGGDEQGDGQCQDPDAAAELGNYHSYREKIEAVSKILGASDSPGSAVL